MSAQQTPPYQPTPDEFEEHVLPLSVVERDEGQPREIFRKEKIASLAKSIKFIGLMNKIEVRHNPKKTGRYLIIAGECRYRALVSLGCKETVFKVYIGKRIDAYLRSVIENGQRQQLNVMEEARAFQRLIRDHDPSEDLLETITGHDIQTVRNRLKLLELDPRVQKLIEEERLPQTSALGLAQYQNDFGTQIRIANDLINGQVSLEFQTREKKLRTIRAPDSVDGQMSRALQFVWRTRSVIPSIEALIANPSGFRQAWDKLPAHAQKNLITQYRTMLSVAGRFIKMVLPAEIPESGEKPAPEPDEPDLQTAGNGTGKGAPNGSPPRAPLAPVRQPISISSGQPPASLEVSHLPEGRVERTGMVVRLLLANPGRHARVNLSRQRLRSIYACGDYPEETALGALRTLWANWDEDPIKYQGKHREFLKLKDEIRSGFGAKTFEEAMRKVWMEDRTLDPVNLALL